MIIDTLDRLTFYSPLNPLLPVVCDFLATHDLDSLAEGWHPIAGEGEEAYLMVATENCRPEEDAELEGHRKYIDIQICLAGHDRVGWRSLGDCPGCLTEYEPEDDLLFCNEKPTQWVDLTAGLFVMLFPDDLHKPLVGEGQVKKLVVKILHED
ncbi:MAG: YhcH/YjgK/YiaL family protein [Lentisphaeria bacterium]|nr:YhcH/YjgK/YiaL family protein [Lentisphaeria bacterium]